MKILLNKSSLEWQEKTRRFVDAELIPSELEAEMNEGKLPGEVSSVAHAVNLLGRDRIELLLARLQCGVALWI